MTHELIKASAQYLVIVPVLLSVYALAAERRKQERIRFALLVLVGGIVSLLIAKLGSSIINDPRPFVVGHFTPLIPHSNDNGFPSDHTLLSAFLGFAILTRFTKLGLLTLALAACIGLARVAAGVHHLEDIIGSFAIAGIAALIMQQAIARLKRMP